jgi:hypothetical protein
MAYGSKPAHQAGHEAGPTNREENLTGTLTKTARKHINGQIQALQRERKLILTGRHLPWGFPWCAGPRGEYHQEPLCDGCAVREHVEQIEAAPLTARIRDLQESLAPVTQETLW